MSALLWVERHDAFIPSHWQPAVLLELMLQLGYNEHKVLRATGMFYDDMLDGEKRISAQQFFQLSENSQILYPGSDLAFRFGQRLFPGNYGEHSHTLASASTVYEGLQAICQLSQHLSPLLTPVLSVNDNYAEIRWLLGFGPSAADIFITEAMCLAVKNYCQTRAQKVLPWEYDFHYRAPRNPQDYELNLSAKLRFDRPISRMRLPREYVYAKWEHSSPLAYARGMNADKPATKQVAFICAVRQQIESQFGKNIGQESIAASLGISVATLKRKCQQHRTSFQQILDQARLERAVLLYCEHGMGSEQVARTLGYFDDANFRRSFRRWTGETPKRYLLKLRERAISN